MQMFMQLSCLEVTSKREICLQNYGLPATYATTVAMPVIFPATTRKVSAVLTTIRPQATGLSANVSTALSI